MSEKYDNYIKEHIGNVEKGYKWMKNHLPKEIFDGVTENDEWNIGVHDLSKYGKEEYDAYDEYFYGSNKDDVRVKERFNKAWLHHIHNNPHHWQYWVLIEDDPENGRNFVCIEMPKHYIIEMVCDWWAFSWASKNLYAIFDWYRAHFANIKLHEKSQLYLEKVLLELKKALNKEVFGYVESQNKYGDIVEHADAVFNSALGALKEYSSEYDDNEELLIDDEEEAKLIDELLDEISENGR